MGTTFEKLLIDRADGFAIIAQPAADEINHNLFRVLSSIDDAENTSTRLPTDHYALAIDKRHREDCPHCGFDVM